MSTSGRRARVAGSALAALAMMIGAIGAHLAKPRLDTPHYEILQTAVQYQFFNALGLLAIGIGLGAGAGARAQPDQIAGLLARAADLLLAGLLLFSGSLYLLVLGAPRWLGALTPIGGLCLILAWCLAAWAWMSPAPRRGPT